MQTWSEINVCKGRRRLHVDGRPYLALGIQYDYLNCTKIEDFDYLFEHTVKMGCNTLFFPVRWLVIEPEEGNYNWNVLDHAIKRCREYDLRLSVLWFGTNQGGSMRCAPVWVRNNAQRFPRIMDKDGNVLDGLCPSNSTTLETEKRALEAMLEHLNKIDGSEHTTILMQVENEVCLRMSHEKSESSPAPVMDTWQHRCYCDKCNAIYKQEGGSEWEFGVRSIIRYLNSLLKDQKTIFPVPAYVNFPVNPLRPGENVEMYLNEGHCIDFVAPDYYGFSPGDLAFTMQHFRQGRNIPFIAEHSTESVGNADVNLYLSICEHGAQGFDPWAIDHTFGWRGWRDGVTEEPFVSKNGEWTQMAISFGKAQSALRCAVNQVAAALGTEDIMYFISYKVPRKMEERRWGIRWRMDSGEDGKWICVRTDNDDFTVLGVDTQVAVESVNEHRKLKVEEGFWKDDQWVSSRVVEPLKPDCMDTKQHAEIILFELDGGKAYRVRSEEI